MKNNFKRVISALLTLSLVLGMTPTTAFAVGESLPQSSDSSIAVSSTVTDSSNSTDTTVNSNSNSDSAVNSNSNSDVQNESSAPTATQAPTVIANGNIYVSNYAVVDAHGNSMTKLTPGSNGIIAVTVIDERIPRDMLKIPAGTITNNVHATMTQGSFSMANRNNISVRMRAPVSGYLCYTVEFRGVTYVGGDNNFSFVVGYSTDGSNGFDVIPFAVEQKLLALTIAQAVDDIPAPNIILNSANYGGNVEAGSVFNLSTSAQNTSDSLELDNVTVKLVLPQGISIANGNNQYLIGKVGKKGAINQAFTLKADAIQTESTSIPVTVQYTFEALVNGKRTSYVSDQQISINVVQPTRFEIASFDTDTQMYTDQEGYCSIKLVNKGKSTVYNVTAEIVSDKFYGADVEFIGNMARGTQNDTEFSLRCDEIGLNNAKLVVTYEDSTGNQAKLEKEFEIEVLETIREEIIVQPDINIDENMQKKDNTPFLIAGVGAVALAAAVIYFKKKKAKRLAELEDDDEDI